MKNMKRILLILTGILLCLQQGHAQQQRQTWTEDFDGASPPTGWTVSSSSVSGSWQPNTAYHQSDPLSTNPQSYRGKLPSNPGDSIVLTTPSYDCTAFDYVYLRFSHICKVSPRDNVRIEYRRDGMGDWKPLPGYSYLGASKYNIATGFNAASYSLWQEDDSTALPAQSWWKEELFDLSGDVKMARVEFRFVIKHGNVQGTQVSYGWLLDNFQLDAAKHEIFPPTVVFIQPYVKDTVHSTGPFEIHAKVKTNTYAPVKTPYLKWSTDRIMYDSVPMTMVQGDSLWKAVIPKYFLGTNVTYAVTGIDTLGNTVTAVSGYVITLGVGGSGGKDVIIQDNGTNSDYYSPFLHNWDYSACMLIYPVDEIDPQAIGAITSIALRVAQAGQGAFPGKIYMKTVPAAKRSWDATSDSYDWATATQDATLVYDGMLGFTTTGWVAIPLQQSFFYNREENLVVLFEQNCGGSSCSAHMGSYPSYYHKATPEVRQWMRYSSGSPVLYGLELQPRSVDLRICVAPAFSDSNSVALKDILSPVQANVTGGQPASVQVTIGNRGGNDLDSCRINWSVNGVLQPHYTWTGNLPWDYEDSPVIGNYTAGIDRYDTVAVWVSMPNGQQDSITWDDTLITILYGCGGPLAGDYTVGAGRDFPTIDEALNLITLCGANADVRLLLPSGVYTQTWDYRDWDLGSIMGNHVLTLASEAGNRDSIIVKPPYGNAALYLGNTSNMGFDGITFDASTAESPAVYIDRPCRNIVINNCSLLADTNDFYSSAPLYIYYQILDNFRLTNSLVDGGYFGVEFYGGTDITAGNFSTNIVFDSNIFRNGSNTNLRIQNTHFTSFSHNKIYSKISHPNYQWNAGWYGLSMSYCNVENMTGNTFLQRYDADNTSEIIKEPHAIEIDNMNKLHVSIPKPMLITNNEIMLPFVHDYYIGCGMRIYSSGAPDAPVHILHNSIRVGKQDNNTDGTGIETVYWTGLHVIKNNNIHTLGQGSYPILLGSEFDHLMDIDANNMYAPNYIGNTGQTWVSSIEEWQQYITTDKSSVSIEPDYINSSKSLELNDYTGLTCYRDPGVTEDIRGTERGGTTGLGCYTSPCPQVDAALVKLLGMKYARAAAGQQDTVKVELFNAGMDPLVSASLCWKINGVIQTTPLTWSGNLEAGEKTEIALGVLTYGYGDNTVEVYICGLGSLTDLNHSNDTLKSPSSYVCQAPLSGTYAIGGAPGARNYPDFDAFANAMDSCGATGAITLEFTGLHSGTLDFAAAADKLQAIPITVTGVTGNDTIYVSGGNAITIGEGNRNIILKNITVKVDADAARCIMITGACTNLVVRNCTLLASPTTTYEGACMYKASNTGMWDSITIVGNRLDGGFHNACFYGGSTSYSPYPNLVVFDSNTCTNAYFFSISAYYSNIRTAYNQISCRVTGNMNSNWFPVFYEYSNGDITGNRITALPSNTPKTGHIMYLNYVNYTNATTPMFVANNEIRYLGTNYSDNGIYIENAGSNNAPLNVVHNSIYVEGGSRPYGIFVGYNIYRCNIKNNNIHMLAPDAYPVFLSYGFNAVAMDIDANNMYAPNYIGFAGFTPVPITSLADWQRIVTSDTRSVKFLPSYADVSSGLGLNDYDSAFCPQFPGCTNDLLQSPRRSTTAMGAYTLPLLNVDLKNSAITDVPATAVQSQAIIVKMNVVCLGDTLIRDATLGWSLNGITQTPPPTHTFAPALNAFKTAEITLGSFTVQDSVTNIAVWIDQVNGKKDDNQLNDTARRVINRIPLVEFTDPFNGDTIYQLSFDVNARINDGTGAPVSTPKLHINTTVNGRYQLYDSVIMVRNGSVWSATVPPQYYGSKVFYWLTVSDNVGNIETVTDSTCIQFSGEVGSSDMIVPQTGSNSYTICGTLYPNLGPASGNSGGYSDYCDGYSVIYPVIPGVMIQVSGTYATEQCCDYVQIYDGIGTGGTMFGEYRGTGTIPALTSTTGPITIRFYSDGSASTVSDASYTGFIINITCYGSTLYSGNSLAVFNVVSPVNNPKELCVSDNAPVKIAVSNLGENDYNFATNPIEVGARIINPFGHDSVYTRRIAGGTLLSGKTDTMEVVPVIPLMYAGQYDIKAWVSSPVDNIPYDDTMHYTYLSGKIGLPVDEDFSSSNLPPQFISKSLVGTNTWMPYQPDTTIFPVKPQFGTGMLRYEGNQGVMARLNTRQLDLHGAINPRLEFWYFHDTASMDESYTDVNIVTDGVSTTLLSVSKKSSTYGWKQYTVPLNIGSAQCVLIEFISTNDNKSGLQSEQYIDRIFITSDQDLKVSDIIITPNITACGLKNKDVYVVIHTPMAQAIDFSRYPTSLALDINGNQIADYPLLHRIAGNTWDTIKVASNISFVPGISNIRAYLTSPVDNNQLNDTATLSLDISPEITVTAQAVSGGTTDCLVKGMEVQQKVTVKNTGNIAVSGIELLLNVIASSQQTLAKSAGSLNPGDSVVIPFDAYTVPADAQYQVQIIGYMGCDSALVNNSTPVTECVDMDDLVLTEILSPDPTDGGIDQVGSTKEIEVSLMNTSDVTSYQNVDITALIEDEDGQVLARHEDIIPVINAPENNMLFKFSQMYTVPDEGVYYVRVFINKVDNYPENDTILTQRSTQNRLPIGERNLFTLEQNIPNPTDNNTIIRYSIPESGEIIFRIHSMNGQILYNKVIDSESGNQSIEINTSGLSSGVYMYSVEYKGHRIVKRMSVKQ